MVFLLINLAWEKKSYGLSHAGFILPLLQRFYMNHKDIFPAVKQKIQNKNFTEKSLGWTDVKLLCLDIKKKKDKKIMRG